MFSGYEKIYSGSGSKGEKFGSARLEDGEPRGAEAAGPRDGGGEGGVLGGELLPALALGGVAPRLQARSLPRLLLSFLLSSLLGFSRQASPFLTLLLMQQAN